MKKKLILFDFDGTITTEDTLLTFIKFYSGTLKFILGFVLLSPVLALFIIKVIPNWKAKELVLGFFFRNADVDHFNKRCEQFSLEVIPTLVRPKALAAIQEYLQNGHEVIVVSASAENWVRPWCQQLGLTCIATKFAVADQKLVGKIQGINCYGAEKERRIKEFVNLSNYSEVIAYGDSRGDKEMLALATTSYYKPFRD